MDGLVYKYTKPIIAISMSSKREQFMTLAQQMTSQIKQEFDLHMEDTDERMNSIIENLVSELMITKNTHPRKDIDESLRCMARVWGNGYGDSQCRFKIKDGDYCSRHSKQASIEIKPCVRDENGKKVGLWCGRIDQWQDDNIGIPPYKDSNNVVQIIWNNDNVKHKIKIDIEDGCKRFYKKKPSKRGCKKQTVVEEEEQTVVEEEEQTVVEEEDSGEELEVEEKEWEGQIFHVDMETKIIYNIEDGTTIGSWDEDNGPNLD